MPNGIYNLDLQDIPPDFPYSIGIHPGDLGSGSTEELFSWLTENVKENCFAIGECGLDSLVTAGMEMQEEVFLRQLKIANEISKPVIIHCVRKFYELIAFRKHTSQPVIMHGFNKKQKVAEDLLANNFYLSVGKPVLYNLSLQNTLKIIPLNRMFLETDDEDFDIRMLYEKVSVLKGISPETLDEQIKENLETIKNG